MSKLTKEFVEGFLERYDGDLSGPILDLADGGNPLHALLEGLDRKDIIEWLQEEFDGLLLSQPRILISPRERIASSCSAFLRKLSPRIRAVYSLRSRQLVIPRRVILQKSTVKHMR